MQSDTHVLSLIPDRLRGLKIDQVRPEHFERLYRQLVLERSLASSTVRRTHGAAKRCQPIGQHAFDAGERGIACRSAAPHASEGEEVAWFAYPGTTTPKIAATHAFDDWIWR